MAAAFKRLIQTCKKQIKLNYSKEMKKKIYLSALLSLSLLACNQAEDPHSSVVPSSSGTFELNLSATVSSDAMRALSFQGLEDLSETPKISANSDFTTHAFFRKAGSPEVGYATIHWEARQEGGRVKLIRPTTNIVLANMSDQTIDEGEEWYVSGIAGGGVLNSEKTAVSFEPDLSSSAEALRAPIAFKWTRIYKNKMINVHFQPKGVLLRAVVANHVGKDVAEIDFDMTSNELDYNGKFDFSAAANSMQAIEQGGHEPVWKFSTGDFGTAQAATLKFRAKDFAKDSKQRIMVWGMSRELSSGQKLTVKPSTAETVEVLRAGRPYLFESKVPMENTQGYTIEMELDVVSPALLFAEHNVNQAGTGFATNDHTESGYFNWKDAMALMSRNTPVFANYHIPSSNEMETIFPYYKTEINLGNPKWKETVSVLRDEEWTTWGHLNFSGLGNFKCMGNGTVYALRYQKATKNTSNLFPPLQDNRRRTAFRYIRQTASSTPAIVVEMIRIGDDPAVSSVDDIANPDWWEHVKQTGRVYRVLMPLAGDKNAGEPAKLQGNVAHYWTSTPSAYDSDKLNPNLANRFLSNETDFHTGIANSAYELTVRLIKDMDI